MKRATVPFWQQRRFRLCGLLVIILFVFFWNITTYPVDSPDRGVTSNLPSQIPKSQNLPISEILPQGMSPIPENLPVPKSLSKPMPEILSNPIPKSEDIPQIPVKEKIEQIPPQAEEIPPREPPPVPKSEPQVFILVFFD